jgi:hypothetical protein
VKMTTGGNGFSASGVGQIETSVDGTAWRCAAC